MCYITSRTNGADKRDKEQEQSSGDVRYPVLEDKDVIVLIEKER